MLDAADSTALPGATVVATALVDSTRRVGVVTNADGAFTLRLPATGTYTLRISFVGFQTFETVRTVGADGVQLGTVVLQTDALALADLIVEGVQERVRLKGDTTEYNATAFKVNTSANAEDLVSKMPGVTIENGQVQAQGETVKRVTVDGQEFFGDDATLALRNLPAEIIDKVQVFDRASDQAQFTGFDDGNSEKTINVVTRGGIRNSQFGKVYGGYGSDTRYLAGANINVFSGNQRLSLIGLTNNVGQQNFAMEDLAGALGGGGEGGRRGGRGGRGGGDAGNFLVGQQNGLTTTHAVGLNYSNRWGEKLQLSSSYFFNGTDNTSDVETERLYVRDGDAGERYDEGLDAERTSYNHRFSARLQADLGERDAITFSPRLSLQKSTSSSLVGGATFLPDGALRSELTNAATSDGLGVSSSANLTYRHRFAREGRTLSLGLSGGLDAQNGDATQNALSLLYRDGTPVPDPALSYNQLLDTDVDGRNLSARLSLTEKIGANGQLQLSYNPSVRKSTSQRNVLAFDETTGAYARLDTAQTSQYESLSTVQRGGLDLQWRKDAWRVSVGLDAQHEKLTGDRVFPTPFAVEETYTSILPSAQISYQKSRTNSLRLFYRTSTSTPSVGQLQDVVDVSNPLFLSTGNPDLNPSYAHRVFARYNNTDPAGGRVIVGYASLSQTNDYVGSANLFARADTLVRGVLVPRGAQLTYPVNLDGQWSARTFVSYGRPVEIVRSNLNVNAGVDYSRTPGLVDNVESISDVLGLTGGLVLGSNISEQVDFTMSYEARLTTAKNSAYENLDSDYTRHRGSLRLVWQPVGGFFVSSDVNALGYQGLDPDLYPTTVQWNAGLGYRFLTRERGEVRLTVADLLDQNNSLDRTITELYVEDTTTQVLGRYVMLTLTYNLRNFQMGAAPIPPPGSRRGGRGE